MRVLWCLLIILAVGVILFFIVFSAAFVSRYMNSEDFIHYFETALSDKIGYRADVEKFNISWQTGLGLQIQNFRLQSTSDTIPFFEADSVFFHLDPFGLLQKRLLFYEMKVKSPRLSLIRARVGKENWERQRGREESSKGAVTPQAGAIPAIGFLFSSVKLDDGSFLYRDEASEAPWTQIEIQNVQARLEQQLPGASLSLKARGSLMSEPPQDLELEGTLNPMEGEAKFTVHLHGDRILLDGRVFPFQIPARFHITGEITQLDLEKFFQGLPLKNRLPLSGTFFGNFDFQGLGSNPQEFKNNLTGNGTLEIRDGSFRNINVLDSVLGQITVIPGIRDVLLGLIPDPLQSSFKGSDTRFDNLQAQIIVRDGQAIIPTSLLKNEFYLIQIQGNIGFDGGVRLQGNLILLEETSTFLIHKIKEFSLLTNPEGRIVIPFVLRGYDSSIRPQPDLSGLAEKLIVDQGTRLIEKGLEYLTRTQE